MEPELAEHRLDCLRVARGAGQRKEEPRTGRGAFFILYEEYDGRVAGSDATFYCPKCRRAIMGRHRRYAGPTTPHLA